MNNITESLTEKLTDIVGAHWVLNNSARLMVYSSDGLPSYKKMPGLAVFPGTQEETVAVIRALAQAKVPFVPRGAGTGLSGGALADGAVLVGLHRLKTLSLDVANRTATVEPGVVNMTLNRLAAKHGLMYAPDPSSEAACTIGGNVAENAGGPHCLKYGVTLNHIIAVSALLPDGEIVKLHKDDTYDLLGAFIGSEGCFGIALDITVRLTEKPQSVVTLLADFTTIDAAARTTSAIIASGIVPAALEFMDGPAIRMVEASIYAAGYPVDAEAVLLIELDGNPDDVQQDVERVKALCREARNVMLAHSEAERAKLWQGRKKAFGAMGRIAPHLMVQDAVIPRSKLPGILKGIYQIGERHGLTVYNIFHAGDGNLHPNIAYDADNPTESAKVHSAMSEIMQLCVQAGGSITGEHGVGLDKIGYMSLMFPEESLMAMCDLRMVFDPEKRANPGKVVPVRSCREWHSTKSHTLPNIKPPTVISNKIRAQTLRARDAILSSDSLKIQGSGTWKEILSHIESSNVFSTREDSGIIEYSPDDFVITVRAGTTIEELSEALRPHNQIIPWNITTKDATVGALIATKAHDTERDHILGLEFVTGRGDIVKSGGKVIKNVAGFNLTRLLAGSYGTLGIITEATIYVRGVERSFVNGSAASAGRSSAAVPSQLEELAEESEDVVNKASLNPPRAQKLKLTNSLSKKIKDSFDPRGVLNPGLIR